MKQPTLYAQICDVLDQYARREIHISDTASLLEEVALKFAKGFGEWIEGSSWIMMENNLWANLDTHQKITTDELLTIFQEYSKNQVNKNPLQNIEEK